MKTRDAPVIKKTTRVHYSLSDPELPGGHQKKVLHCSARLAPETYKKIFDTFSPFRHVLM
jgi:hypothetical protein